MIRVDMVRGGAVGRTGEVGRGNNGGVSVAGVRDAARKAEGRAGIMADVDIDLYGDVEQDFTQVRYAAPHATITLPLVSSTVYMCTH